MKTLVEKWRWWLQRRRYRKAARAQMRGSERDARRWN